MEDVEIAACAREALLVEARLTPKPGLVDAANSGAHEDMDLSLLEASADALEPVFEEAAAWGRRGGLISELRDIGRAGEARMLAATSGVNTHKGALFSLGLWCAARAATPLMGDARLLVGTWAAGLRAVHVASTPTAGERAGVPGARGQAELGHPLVFDVALPAMRATPGSAGLLRALVALMAANDDTNLLHRGGGQGLRDVRSWAADHVCDVDPTDALREANTWFTARRLSPGGSADLLALAWFVDTAFARDE